MEWRLHADTKDGPEAAHLRDWDTISRYEESQCFFRPRWGQHTALAPNFQIAYTTVWTNGCAVVQARKGRRR